MAMPEEVPCRLYVILAREAPIAVIFRRGPSRWVQIIRWETSTDTFTPGQWFHGRIYERRSGISPNGKLLVYAARKESVRTHSDEEYTEFWTAISRPPYLTALALWPCRSSMGGGLFLSDAKVWLNHWSGATEPHPAHKPQGLAVEIEGDEVSEATMLARRLERDGWRNTQAMESEYTFQNRGYTTHVPGVRRKQNPHGWQKLTMTSTRKGFKTTERYSVRYTEGQDWPLEGASWADWDQRGRLVYARGGKLYAAEFGETMIERELADFNDQRPEPMATPEWAKVW